MSNILSNFSERLSELMSEEELNPRSIGEDIGHNFYDFYHWKSEKIKYLPRLPVLIEIALFFLFAGVFAGNGRTKLSFLPC